MESRPYKPYIIPGTLLLLAGIAFYPALKLLMQKWSGSEDYTHAFFIVPVIGYMVWAQRKLFDGEKGGSFFALLLVILSALAYCLSLQVQVPTFIFLATVLSIISTFIYLGGLRIIKELLIPILLLFLIIPIPNQILSAITGSLQLKITEVCEVIIRLVGIPMFREGNVIHVEGISFQVVEACSGIRSLLSMTTLSILVGYFTDLKLFSSIILFLLSIPIALLINLLRVLVLVLAYHFLRVDLSVGLSHTVTGMVLFIFGLTLLFSLQRVLKWWETK